MHGDADRTRLIGDGARDRLPNPPRRIGTELVALVVVELLDRLDEAEIAFLYEIEEQHAPADIALGNAHDETKIRLCQFLLRFLIARFHALGKGDFLICGKERHAADLLQIHAHGIVDADSLGNAEIDIHLFLSLVLVHLRLCTVRIIHNFDALVAERLVKVVDFIRREFLLLQCCHQLAVGQHAAVAPPFCEKARHDGRALRRLLVHVESRLVRFLSHGIAPPFCCSFRHVGQGRPLGKMPLFCS